MNQQQAKELLGPEILAVFPLMTEAQQQGIRAGLSAEEQRALDIALGLALEDEQLEAFTEALSQAFELPPAPEVLIVGKKAETAPAAVLFAIDPALPKSEPVIACRQPQSDHLCMIKAKPSRPNLNWLYLAVTLALLALAIWAALQTARPAI